MLRAIVLGFSVVLLPACIIIEDGHRGPPSHAPAHGARNKLRYEHRYDAVLGVDIVIGQPGYYFYDDVYWRFVDGYWHRSALFDGPWLVVKEVRHVPPGLLKKQSPKGYRNDDLPASKGKDKKKH